MQLFEALGPDWTSCERRGTLLERADLAVEYLIVLIQTIAQLIVNYISSLWHSWVLLVIIKSLRYHGLHVSTKESDDW